MPINSLFLFLERLTLYFCTPGAFVFLFLYLVLPLYLLLLVVVWVMFN
jgi:hypothetical protein